MIKTAFILVGGKETSLSPPLAKILKFIAPIAGAPFLDHVLFALKRQGIESVVLLASHMADELKAFENRQAEFGLKIRLDSEVSALGSAGALKNAESALAEDEDHFLVLTGDTFFEGDLKLLLESRPTETELVAMGLVWLEEASRFNTVELDLAQRVTKCFIERGLASEGYVYIGSAVFHRQIFTLINSRHYSSIEQNLFPSLPEIKAVLLKGKLFDIGIATSYAALNADLVLRRTLAENPGIATILSVMLDGGRIVSLGDRSANLLGLVPDVISYQQLAENEEHILSRLTPKDMVIVENDSVDFLWALGGITSATVVLLSDKNIDQGLYDCLLSERELRSGLLEIRKLWQQLKVSQGLVRASGEARRPALFLDRDGVVIDFVDYIRSPDQVKLVPGISVLLRQAREKGFAVVVVTNQAGIGREYYSWSSYDAVTARMQELLAAQGVWIDRIVCSAYIPVSQRHYGLMRRSLRKPRAGMILSVAEDLGIDVRKSVMVGDFATDLMAAAIAGMGKVFLLRTENYQREITKWKSWSLLSRTKFEKDLNILEKLSDVTL